MAAGPRIDRTKRDADVAEHVARGVRTDTRGAGVRVEVVDLRVSSWLAGHVISAGQVRPLGRSDEPDDDR